MEVNRGKMEGVDATKLFLLCGSLMTSFSTTGLVYGWPSVVVIFDKDGTLLLIDQR